MKPILLYNDVLLWFFQLALYLQNKILWQSHLKKRIFRKFRRCPIGTENTQSFHRLDYIVQPLTLPNVKAYSIITFTY